MEETISLSRIYKSVHLNDTDKKLIEVKKPVFSSEKEKNQPLSQDELQDIEQQKAQLLLDAEEMAERIIEQSKGLAEQLKADTKKEIDQWWIEQRTQDEIAKSNAEEQGYKKGYEAGFLQAEEEVKKRYLTQMEQVKYLVEQAYQLKEQIVEESEPVILQLSVMVAEKIILKEIEQTPDIIKEIAQAALRRTREYEKITIDVHPDHFLFLQDAREELKLELNGQVELLIYPDPALSQGGCMIRTTTGTIDARIDTQLDEIKKALVAVREKFQG